MKSGSNLERVLTSGTFAVTGELGPPKNADPEVVRKKARILRGFVDAANITDCQTAIVRLSSIGAGLLAQAEGLEPVIQMTCRDRNRIGMQSDILGATALGLKNLLCLTGDHQKFGNHAGAKGVFDMDSIQMLSMVKAMRDDKRFQCGEEIKGREPRLFLGAAANPFAGPFEFRAARLGKKAAAGADFVQTQIIYNVEKFGRFMQMVRDLGLAEKIYILAGVTPPKSVGMARYMKNFVPGMDVTDEVISRMKDAKDKEEEGINICVDIIKQVQQIKGVAGVHVMAIEWESAVPEIVKRAGLLPRPAGAVPEAKAPMPQVEKITVASNAAQEESEQILARAKAEAAELIARARDEIARMRAEAAPARQPSATVRTTSEIVEAGEDEMNERERQMALESVRMGLEALRKSLGLSADQFDALKRFAEAETILTRQAQGAVLPPGTGQEDKTTPTGPTSLTGQTSQTDQAAVAARKAAQAKAEEESRKLTEAKAAEERRQAEEAKKAQETTRLAAEKAEAEAAQKATEAKKLAEAKAAEAKKAEEEKAKVAAATKAPVATAAPTIAALAVETTLLKDRATKVPTDGYTEQYKGQIREVALGNEGKIVPVGGAATMPFHLFEGAMPRRPIIAMDVLDSKPEDWPQSLAGHFQDVLDNPVAWAQKCVNKFGAEAICISLASTDPNGQNRPASEAAKTAAAVINSIDVPIIVWGCGNADKDTETLREVTAQIGNKKVCLAPVGDTNYRSLGATAMAFQHSIAASSPIDVNLAKQLNILLENLGMPLSSVLIDPSIGALGYGIEYTYSVMERIRLAALTQKDEKLQVPFICNVGREVWKTKECRLPTDAQLGDQERRGVLMEAVTAVCMLLAGGEVLVMRHPTAMSLTKTLIHGLMG